MAEHSPDAVDGDASVVRLVEIQGLAQPSSLLGTTEDFGGEDACQCTVEGGSLRGCFEIRLPSEIPNGD
ncbi:MAG: hypothetical protein ACRD2W_20890 [Acidimicrobiales bacterium]